MCAREACSPKCKQEPCPRKRNALPDGGASRRTLVLSARTQRGWVHRNADATAAICSPRHRLGGGLGGRSLGLICCVRRFGQLLWRGLLWLPLFLLGDQLLGVCEEEVAGGGGWGNGVGKKDIQGMGAVFFRAKTTVKDHWFFSFTSHASWQQRATGCLVKGERSTCMTWGAVSSLGWCLPARRATGLYGGKEYEKSPVFCSRNFNRGCIPTRSHFLASHGALRLPAI